MCSNVPPAPSSCRPSVPCGGAAPTSIPEHARLLLGLTPPKPPSPEAADATYDLLSPREQQVLRLIALGHTNLQVADRLGLSVKTVETYKSRLMTKLGLTGRAALVRYALQQGLLEEQD